MIENSKKIVEDKDKDKENIKNEEDKKNGSSVKERGGFRKRLKKFGNSSDYKMINNLEIANFKNRSTPNSVNNSQNKV